MVAPSKVFVSPLTYYHCSQSLVHPGKGCTRYFIDNLIEHFLAGLKYFTPFLLTPLVMKYKTMDQELFKSIVKYYLQTVGWSSLAISCAFLSSCCLRNFLGNYRFYTKIFVPTLMGMQFCWFFPERALKLFTTATSQSALETILRQHSNKFTHLLLHSPMVQTILFMLNSAIILHYKRKNIYRDFWFIQPHDKVNEKEVKEKEEVASVKEKYGKSKVKCVHMNQTCKQFMLNGMKSYLIYGIPLDLFAMIMKSKIPTGTQGFFSKTLEKFKNFRPAMTGFFLSYVGIYRLSSCMLHKYFDNLPQDLQHLLSAFLGGLSFLCVKRGNFVFYALVVTTQILWQQFCDSIKTAKSDRKPNLVLLMLKNTPFSQIFLSLNCAYLVHNSILNYPIVSGLARGFLDALTCNKTKGIYYNLVNSDMQTLIENSKLNPIKTFL